MMASGLQTVRYFFIDGSNGIRSDIVYNGEDKPYVSLQLISLRNTSSRSGWDSGSAFIQVTFSRTPCRPPM